MRMQSRETSASEMCLGLREERLRAWLFQSAQFLKISGDWEREAEDKISSEEEVFKNLGFSFSSYFRAADVYSEIFQRLKDVRNCVGHANILQSFKRIRRRGIIFSTADEESAVLRVFNFS